LRQPERLNQPLNLLTRLNRFVRVIEERVSRGATQVKFMNENYRVRKIINFFISLFLPRHVTGDDRNQYAATQV
jgi:hypothetical protein